MNGQEGYFFTESAPISVQLKLSTPIILTLPGGIKGVTNHSKRTIFTI